MKHPVSIELSKQNRVSDKQALNTSQTLKGLYINQIS